MGFVRTIVTAHKGGCFKVGSATLVCGNLVGFSGGKYGRRGVLLGSGERRAVMRCVGGVVGMGDMMVKETFEIVKGSMFWM